MGAFKEKNKKIKDKPIQYTPIKLFFLLLLILCQKNLFPSTIDLTEITNQQNELENIISIINETTKIINSTIAQQSLAIEKADELLLEIKKDLESISFDETDTNTTINGEFYLTNDINNRWPQWVIIAQLTSPTVTIVEKKNKNKKEEFYCLKNKDLFLLIEGDHNLWVDNCILYGYTKYGSLFIQKQNTPRICASTT